MHYGEIKVCDVANGPGVRVTLFVSGCTNRCEGCFQPQTWAFDFGKPFTAETENYILEQLAPSYIKGLTVLGGEPFEPSNQAALLPFLRRYKAQYPDKNLWMFSGFTFEEMTTPGHHANCPETAEILNMVDVLVDGRFVLAQRDLTLRFRGSRNQRLLDMPATLKAGKATLWEG